ncbi:dynamin family protein [Roseobacter sp.]|uniref:dynamin family protein n=1 Tax=Roseobacter sp. TaxID=1907202 RepID=UPI002967595D|nr:dynamin family protein [Roseobacter sp.]
MMTLDETPQDAPVFLDNLTGPRRPRIALMGEFSAGKSTLANLMIGSDPLPVQVIATQLPPVWVSYGTAPAVIVDLAGNETPCDQDSLRKAIPEETAFIRIQCEEEILKRCDIIDMPGISDPNMPSAVWERILPAADGIIWCSPATQAWRQSEASVWDMVPEDIRAHSILLLTRGDMMVSEKDRAKVLKRVRAETDGFFAKTLMISLTQARDAGDDAQLWDESGAEPFVSDFLSIISTLSARLSDDMTDAPSDAMLDQNSVPAPDAAAPPEPSERIVPRRPIAKSVRARPAPRPDPEEDISLSPKFS